MLFLSILQKVFCKIGKEEQRKAEDTKRAVLRRRKLLACSDVVAPPRLELGTQGSSSLCSTN